MKKLLLVLITCLGAASVHAALNGALAERFPNSIHGGGAAGADAMLWADSAQRDFWEIRPNMRVQPNVRDNYNGRLTAWFVPPVSGDYRFMIASDDNGRLWLSSDADPANATRIAYHDSWTADQDWNEATLPTRVSAWITLEGGKLYWMRAGFAEGGGDDNLSVAWWCPDAGVSTWQVIPGEHLFWNLTVEELAENLVLYEVWDGDVGDLGFTPGFLPDFSLLGNPDGTGMLGAFGVGPRAGADDFLFRQYGIIQVDEAQTLGFGTVSDDGSKLYVGNWWEDGPLTLVVNNDGWHGPQWRQGVIDVEPGYVGIVVEMFEDGGGEALQVFYWNRDQVRKEMGQAELIAYRGACLPSPLNGEENVSLDADLSWHNGFLSGAPVDVYFGEAGNMTKVVDQGDVTSFDPGTLEYGTIYNWRVDVVDPNEGGNPIFVQGPVWAFKTVGTDVVITEQPTRYVRADAGDEVVLSVAATSALTPLEYEWKKGDTVVGTDATLVIASLGEADEGEYTCVVSNAESSATSSPADVKIKAQIAYYPLDEDLADPTGAGPEGIYHADEGKDVAFEEGVVGNAIAINIDAEYNEYVSFGVPGDLGIFGEAPRTIACWAKNAVPWDQIDDWCTIFGFTSTTGTSEHSFDFNRRGGQNQYCIHRYGAEWNMQEIDGEWHFLTASFDNGTIHWYVDGVYGGSATTNLQSQDILHLGKRAHSAQLWRGWVDEARVFNYAITPQQVADLYAESGMAVEAYCPPIEQPAFDVDGNCVVDTGDLLIVAEQWLQSNVAE